MKIYKTKTGIVLEDNGKFFSITDQSWDDFINDDNLLEKARGLITKTSPGGNELIREVMAPIS